MYTGRRRTRSSSSSCYTSCASCSCSLPLVNLQLGMPSPRLTQRCHAVSHVCEQCQEMTRLPWGSHGMTPSSTLREGIMPWENCANTACCVKLHVSEQTLSTLPNARNTKPPLASLVTLAVESMRSWNGVSPRTR